MSAEGTAASTEECESIMAEIDADCETGDKKEQMQFYSV